MDVIFDATKYSPRQGLLVLYRDFSESLTMVENLVLSKMHDFFNYLTAKGKSNDGWLIMSQKDLGRRLGIHQSTVSRRIATINQKLGQVIQVEPVLNSYLGFGVKQYRYRVNWHKIFEPPSNCSVYADLHRLNATQHSPDAQAHSTINSSVSPTLNPTPEGDAKGSSAVSKSVCVSEASASTAAEQVKPTTATCSAKQGSNSAESIEAASKTPPLPPLSTGVQLGEIDEQNSIADPEPAPSKASQRLQDLKARFRANRQGRSGEAKSPEEQRIEADRLMALQSERYAEPVEDPDKDLPSATPRAAEGPLDQFVVSLADTLNLDALLAILGPINDPLPGRAPKELSDRLWDTYRQWRPNGWHEPAKLGESRVLCSQVDALWRAMADPQKSTTENCAVIELAFRAALLYLHSKPWFSSAEFQSKHLTYLLKVRSGQPSPIELYSEQWRSLPSADRQKTLTGLTRLLEARDRAINN